MSMGPDIFLTYLTHALRAGMTETHKPEDLALRVLALGTVGPIVDSFTDEVVGFQFELVARRHTEAREGDA